MTIKDLIRFSDLLVQFRKVERVIHVHNQNREENDVEHSYMLAMLAWYICSTEKLKLNLDKVVTYALAHDLVEVYAGDTFLYSKNKKLHKSKHERECNALQRIIKEFPEFKDLHMGIKEYEKRADPESKFIYALDKIQPILMVYLDHGYSWKRDKITFDMIKEAKNPKVKISPQIEKYWNEFLKILEKEKMKLFPKKEEKNKK